MVARILQRSGLALPKIFAAPNERATPRLFSRQPRSAAPTFGPNPVFFPRRAESRFEPATICRPGRIDCCGGGFRPFRYDAVDDSKLRPFAAVGVGKAETVSRFRGSDACAHRRRGDLFISGARPGLICAGLRGDTGLGVGRVTVAPFSLLISGTQLGDGCGP